MKIGLVGYQGSGKSTLFGWLTGMQADPALSHTTQSAMATVPDERIESLCAIYHPKKVTRAALEIVDTPGLVPSHEGAPSHAGNAARLSMIREAGCLVHVVGAFQIDDPFSRLASFDEDLLLADLEIVTRRVEKLRESVKKPRPSRDQEFAELAALEPLLEALESGTPLAEIKLSEEQLRVTRPFQLLTEKPRFIFFNLADDEQQPDRFLSKLDASIRGAAVPVGLAAELAEMDAEDRAEFEREMGIAGAEAGPLIREIMDASGQMLFFTAGDKEVRSWMIRRGSTAIEAAEGIHTDFARGFIRAESMTCDDLFRLGSEREVKAANLMHRESKDYVIQDGDILYILSNV